MPTLSKMISKALRHPLIKKWVSCSIISQDCFSYAQCVGIFLYIMHTKHVGAPRAQKRSQRHRRCEPVAHIRGADQFGEKRFAGNANHERAFIHSKSAQIVDELEIMLQRFPETDSRIKRNGHGINLAL